MIKYKKRKKRNGKVIAEFKADINPPYASCHVDVLSWSHNNLKEMQRVFKEEILPDLEDLGVVIITASTLDLEDKKWNKLVKLFGFSSPLKAKTSFREVGNV